MNTITKLGNGNAQIKTIDAYQTTDGKIWTSMAEAEIAQSLIDVTQRYASDECTDNGSQDWQDTLAWVCENYRLAPR